MSDKKQKEVTKDEDLDVFKLAHEVAKDSASGALAKELLNKGEVLYAPAPEGSGLVNAHYSNGDVVKGLFKNGVFTPAA